MMKLEQDFIKIEKINPGLLDKFLEPYQEHCKYLKKAQFQYPAFQIGTGWSVEAEFQIPSYDIDRTKHFNAVEFNICYNQLYYITVAYLVQNNLLELMQDWDLDIYKNRQLSNFLVVKFASTFEKHIDRQKFYGTLKINQFSLRGNLIMMQTSCAFYDLNRGWAEGEATIAVLNSESNKIVKPKIRNSRSRHRVELSGRKISKRDK